MRNKIFVLYYKWVENMQKYLERMITEKQELDGRIQRAEKVIENPPFDSDSKGIELLKKQVESMKVYQQILHDRIIYEGARK